MYFIRLYLPQMVYWAIDGTITTFAVVAGATGGGLSAKIIIILWFANLLADGVSMSIGAYLSAKTEDTKDKTPLSIGIATLISFIVIGFVPLIPYVFGFADFRLSCVMTWATFIGIGVIKWYLTRKSMVFSASQTFALWVIAAIIAYSVGVFLKGL